MKAPDPKPALPKTSADRKAAVERWCSGSSWKDEISRAAARAEKPLVSAGRVKEFDMLDEIVSELRAPGATQDTCAKNAVKLSQLLAAGGQN